MEPVVRHRRDVRAGHELAVEEVHHHRRVHPAELAGNGHAVQGLEHQRGLADARIAADEDGLVTRPVVDLAGQTQLEGLGFGKYKNVITNVMMERLAATDGPTGRTRGSVRDRR